jgi:hypothetical protein
MVKFRGRRTVPRWSDTNSDSPSDLLPGEVVTSLPARTVYVGVEEGEAIALTEVAGQLADLATKDELEGAIAPLATQSALATTNETVATKATVPSGGDGNFFQRIGNQLATITNLLYVSTTNILALPNGVRIRPSSDSAQSIVVQSASGENGLTFDSVSNLATLNILRVGNDPNCGLSRTALGNLGLDTATALVEVRRLGATIATYGSNIGVTGRIRATVLTPPPGSSASNILGAAEVRPGDVDPDTHCVGTLFPSSLWYLTQSEAALISTIAIAWFGTYTRNGATASGVVLDADIFSAYFEDTISVGSANQSGVRFRPTSSISSKKNGDMWFDGADFWVRVSDTDKKLSLIS